MSYKKSTTPKDPLFPQDGGELPRDAWLSTWPVSAKGNEWVRAFGYTYTLIESSPPCWGELPFSIKLVVVGPGGRRVEKTFDRESSRSIKEWLWASGTPAPWGADEVAATELAA